MLATGGAARPTTAPGEASASWQAWDARARGARRAGDPGASARPRRARRGRSPTRGLTPLDAATQVAIPEFDGRLLGGVISFKERDAEGSPVGVAGAALRRPTPSAARASRGSRSRHARLRRTPAAERRGRRPADRASRPSTRGSAWRSGSTRPPARSRCSTRCAPTGMRRRARLRRRRRADPRADRRRRPRPRVPHRRRSSPPRRCACRSPTTCAWYATLPERRCATSMEERWGPPPGDRYVDGDDFVIAGLELGNVVVAIQPPRGYGEDPVGDLPRPRAAADPPLPRLLPLARRGMGRRRDRPPRQARHARVAAGQDARAERGVRARRRARRRCRSSTRSSSTTPARACRPSAARTPSIVDHLVPPMMRADTYDELAELEALLDEYARLEVLDPSKLPGLAARIWTAIEAANLQADLGIARAARTTSARSSSTSTATSARSRTSRSRTGCTSSARRPRASSCAAWWRRCCGSGPATCPGCGARSARRYGLDEPALVAAPGAPAPTRPGRRCASASPARRRAPATSSTGSRTRSWRCSTGSPRATGTPTPRGSWPRRARRDDDGVERALRFAVRRGRPAHLRTPDELTARASARCTAATSPAGPSGAPTRGRIDVLPTGRNFYSRRPARAAVRAVLGGRPRGSPTRCSSATARDTGELPRDGRARRVGHGRDAHPGRRRRRDPRAARRAADVAPGVAAGHRHRGDPARPSSGRPRIDVDRAHLRLLPRRLPAPRRRCSTTR